MIKTVHLTKKYDNMYAINDINLDLAAGDVFGFIGPNGAGKTTTMRIIATLLEPTVGEAYVGGVSVITHPKEIRRLVGYMPDFFGVYDDMTVIEYLEFFAAAYKISGPQRRKRCNEMLEIVDLEFKRDAYANTLSRGQTQRLGLARVLIHDPQVLLLDEPLSGLDPRARIEMRGLMKRLGQMGKTIIVSSHILPELADVCNKVGIINSGEMKENANVADVIAKVRPQIVLLVEPALPTDLDRMVRLIESHPDVESVTRQGERSRVVLKAEAKESTAIAWALLEAKIAVRHFAEEEINLESAFMALTTVLVRRFNLQILPGISGRATHLIRDFQVPRLRFGLGELLHLSIFFVCCVDLLDIETCVVQDEAMTHFKLLTRLECMRTIRRFRVECSEGVGGEQTIGAYVPGRGMPETAGMV